MFFLKQKSAYEMRISNWSSDVCSSDPCDEGLAEASPAAFVTDWLASGLGVGGVVSSHDFTFGHDRRGDIALLDRLCADMGFEAEAVPALADGGGVISSSRIRAALKAARKSVV